MITQEDFDLLKQSLRELLYSCSPPITRGNPKGNCKHIHSLAGVPYVSELMYFIYFKKDIVS